MFEALRKRLKETISGFARREEKAEKPEMEGASKTTEVTAAAPVNVHRPEKAKRVIPEEHVPEPAQEKREARAAPIKSETRESDKAAAERQEAPKIDLKFTTKIKKIFTSRITLSSAEIDGFADGMKESLLRSDVAYDTTEEFVHDLKVQLASKPISSGRIDSEVTDVVRGALSQILDGSSPKESLNEMVARRISEGISPVKMLFLGPNGAGKTTTIAKLAYNFKEKGISSVLSASDTFRAAAIEQLELHAKRIGVPIIKSKYGADPASVAFDAIAHAKSSGIQLVLIDSAGRQETNKSLISEIEKMVRVCKPDMTIFIGESTAGNVIAEQIGEFGKHVRIDGIILTKLDCDAKGGSALSIAKTTGVPIMFFGTGEGYDALMPYSTAFVVDAILPAS